MMIEKSSLGQEDQIEQENKIFIPFRKFPTILDQNVFDRLTNERFFTVWIC